MKIYVVVNDYDMYQSPSIEYVTEYLEQAIELAESNSNFEDIGEWQIQIWENGTQLEKSTLHWNREGKVVPYKY